ncbi:MAG: hypothetical protein Ct9H300mP30_0300 [Methanobacteriota archaeon]|nr:MAG: hypothetical protein Ct9H300mP30_0300 [Euryarchaeota archaeon]
MREIEIVDASCRPPDDVLSVNMIQRMTDSGRRVRFNVLCVFGNGDGYVGSRCARGRRSRAPSARPSIGQNSISFQ